MKKYTIICALLTLTQSLVFGQQIKGTYTTLPNQMVKLQGFSDFDAYTIDSTTTDSQGNFKFTFSDKDYGMGVINNDQGDSQILILTDETVAIKSDKPSILGDLEITEGKQNQALLTYVTQQQVREQSLSAWSYLQELYHTDTQLSTQQNVQNTIDDEITRLNNEELNYLSSLPEESYVRWFLPIRKLVSSVSVVAQYKQDLIPTTRESLRKIDLTDDRMYKSGLLRETIENHIWFIENSSGDLDKVFAELNKSIDIIIEQLKDDNDKFNLITSKMFEVMEKRSLFTSSEYLAKRLLNGDDCGCLNPDFEKKLNKYGKMATGETAPDIHFSKFTYFPDGVKASKLSEVTADYYLVVFAAGWCPHCTTEMPKIVDMYPDLKAKNIEVILVSLDESAKDFAQFAAPLPFISTTDFKKWDSQPVIDYQVYGTPSYFMLDKNLKIVNKLKSPDHVQAWTRLIKD